MRKPINLWLIVVIILALSLSPAGAARAQGSAGSISVTGEAQVKVVPDEVTLAVGVETINIDLLTAKQQNDSRAKAIVALATKYEIKPEHVQTDFITVQPRYEDSYLRQVLVGYVVRKTIVFTLKQIDRFEDLLTDVLAAGANYVYGIDFHTTELRKHRDQARDLAIKAAKEKAVALAGALGQTIGAPTSIREDQIGWYSSYSRWGMGSSMSQNVVQDTGGGAESVEGGFAPGQIVVSARVSVTFELK
jgi:uncharacterized protein YggE